MSLISAQDAYRLLWAKSSRRISAAVVVASSIGLLITVPLTALTYLSQPPSFVTKQGLVWIGPLGLPMFAWAVLLTICLAGGTYRGGLAPLPRWSDTFGIVTWRAVLVFLGFAIFGIISSASAIHGPTSTHFDADRGIYVVNYGGSVTAVTRAEYQRVLATEVRGGVGTAMLLFAVAVPIALNHWLYRRAADRTRGQADAASPCGPPMLRSLPPRSPS